MKLTKTLLTSLSLAAVLGAQEEAARTTTKSQAPLSLASSDPGLVLGLAFMIGGEHEMPELAEGEVAVVTLDDGGVPTVGKKAGTKYLEVHARPALLASMFPDAVEMARFQMEEVMTGAMAMSGQDPEGAMAFANLLFDLPKQMESVHITLPDNPEEDMSLDLDLEVTPVADSLLAKVHAALNNTEKGVPQLPMKDAWMTMTMDVDYSKLGPYFGQFTDMYLGMMGISLEGEDTAEMKKSWEQLFAATTGAMSMGWSFDRGLMAVIDAGKEFDLAGIMNDDNYRKISADLAKQQGMEISFGEDGEHRGAKIFKTIMKMPELAMMSDMMPFPMLEDGAMVQRTASVGRYTVFSMFGADMDVLKPLIENAADDKIQHRKTNSLFSMYMDMGAMMERMADMMGGAIEEDVPQTIEMAVRKTKSSFKLEVDIR